MKILKKSCAMAVSLCGIYLSLASSVWAAPDPNFHIYIAYGQSNMAGAGDIRKGVDDVEHPRYKMFATTACAQLNRPTVGEIYPAIPPMFHCGEGLSIADWFGRYMADSLPDVTVGVIPVAVGGTKIELFDKDKYANYLSGEQSWLVNWAKDYGADGNAYARIVEIGKKAQEVGVIKGVIFHQGESGAMNGNDWKTEVKKTRDDIFKALNLSADTVPFLAGEMEDSDAGGCCYTFALNQVGALPNIMENTYVVKSTGLKGNGKDSYHFSSESYQEFGRRYAEKMLQVMNKAPVEPVPQEPFKGVATKAPGKLEVEDFDKPGIGKGNDSYYDKDSENQGKSTYREGGVDLYDEGTGVVLEKKKKEEWLEYTMDFEAGDYTIDISVASGAENSSFQLLLDEKNLGDEVKVKQTADNKWDVYETVSVDAGNISAGKHIFKLLITGDYVNIDFFEFKLKSSAGDTTTSIRQSLKQKKFAESNTKYFDLHGNEIPKSKAQKLGIYVVKIPGVKAYLKKMKN